MDKGLVKVLLVEDDAVDSRLVKRVVAECPQPAELRLGWNWTDNPANTFFIILYIWESNLRVRAQIQYKTETPIEPIECSKSS